MKKLNGTEIKALLILSIVVPVGLLAAFRFTGILGEPPEVCVERITVEPVTLALQRPLETCERIDTSAQNVWTQESASITAGIDIATYSEGFLESPFYGCDGLTFKTYVNASVARGYLSTVRICFHPVDANAVVFVSEQRWSLDLENAMLTSLRYWSTNETEAYIKANVLNSSCSVSDQIFWVFLDENESHELKITVEVVHTDETTTKIITIPIRLRIAPSEEG